MTTLLQNFEEEQINKLTSKKNIPTFRSGDTIKVTLKITEGERSRLQIFEGMCIARKNNSINSKFTIRKISHGEGVERVFPLFSPIIEKIEVVRKGNTRRAKLYYLRSRTGKRARIADRDRGEEADQYELKENTNVSKDIEESNKEEKKQPDEENFENIENKKKESINIKSEEEKKESSADEQSEDKKSESSVPKAENTENESKS